MASSRNTAVIFIDRLLSSTHDKWAVNSKTAYKRCVHKGYAKILCDVSWTSRWDWWNDKENGYEKVIQKKLNITPQHYDVVIGKSNVKVCLVEARWLTMILPIPCMQNCSENTETVFSKCLVGKNRFALPLLIGLWLYWCQ